jgi:hypothetical protein
MPKSVRIQSPRLNALACTSNRFKQVLVSAHVRTPQPPVSECRCESPVSPGRAPLCGCDSPCPRRPPRSSVSWIVVVSPSSASCTAMPTIAPVSRSMACSALWARCVRPSLILVILASGSWACVPSSFDRFFLRFRSIRGKSARRRVDARSLGGLRQKFLVGLTSIPPHDTAQRRVGFQRRGIDADRLALDL